MSNTTGVELTTLLSPKPYLLGYAIPLLLISLVLTFAGTFLTLDRTRMFAPRSDAVQPVPGAFGVEKPKKFAFVFEGGVGGVLGGVAFGVHFSTFLALLIPNTTSSAPLSAASFVAVWVLSSISAAALAARFRIAALLFFGMSGGATFGVALAIILHPAQLSRVIVTAVFTAALTILVLLPLPRFQHGLVRFTTASTGTFGLLVSLALLAHISSWADAWSRLWTPTSSSWDSAQEKGLDAAYCAFIACGAIVDWFLRRSFGENPDQKWDSYLATYAANLPTAAGEGSFQPFTSVWDRIFGSNHPPAALRDPMRFPTDAELHAVPRLRKHKSTAGRERPDSDVEMLRRKGDVKGKYGVKFRPLGGFSSGSDSEDDDVKLLQSPESSRGGGAVKPWLLQRNETSLSNDTTLADDETARAMAAKKAALAGVGGGDGLDYSDYESDEGEATARKKRRESLGTPEWTPGFMDRHRRQSGQSGTGAGTSKGAASMASTATPPGAVPVTPSLMNALDRIALAQKTAYSDASSSSLVQPIPTPGLPEGGDRWGAFWKDVWTTAGQPPVEGSPGVAPVLRGGELKGKDGQVK